MASCLAAVSMARSVVTRLLAASPCSTIAVCWELASNVTTRFLSFLMLAYIISWLMVRVAITVVNIIYLCPPKHRQVIGLPSVSCLAHRLGSPARWSGSKDGWLPAHRLATGVGLCNVQAWGLPYPSG